ncbi:hypothetical protein [Cryptosporangium sp. NPDC051539]|uniref:hypothetical protein n=1 Tax=Cryptosporangium sp. NPDC051539 TaxID=3363962 RepID=UPI0037A1FC27
MNEWMQRSAGIAALTSGLVLAGAGVAQASPVDANLPTDSPAVGAADTALQDVGDNADLRRSSGGQGGNFNSTHGDGTRSGSGGDFLGPARYNPAGSVSPVNFGYGGSGGDGGDDNSASGNDVEAGSGGKGGPGIYNEAGSYSLVNVGIGGVQGADGTGNTVNGSPAPGAITTAPQGFPVASGPFGQMISAVTGWR